MPHDERVVPLPAPVPVATTQGTLALELEPRCEIPAPGRVPRPTAGTPGTPGGSASVVPIDRRSRREVEAWAQRFAQAVMEIVGGDRPASQLVRWTSRDVHLDLTRRAVLVGRAGGHVPGQRRVQPVRPRVHSVHSCFVSPRVVETSMHVRYGERSRAFAARFERSGDAWVCTALDFA